MRDRHRASEPDGAHEQGKPQRPLPGGAALASNRALARVLRGAEGAGEGSDVISERLRARIDAERGSGTAPPSRTREEMEEAFYHDFADVQVHHGAAATTLAEGLSAHAFTVGRDIFFAGDAKSEAEPAGHALLVHELAHVIQQGRVDHTPSRVSRPTDPSEQQAHAAVHAVRARSDAAADTGRPPNVGSPSVQRTPDNDSEIHGEVEVTYGPLTYPDEEQPTSDRPPVRFDPELAEAEAAAKDGIAAGGLALKTLKDLSDDQLAEAERQLAELAAESDIPAEELAFLTRRGLRQGVSDALGLLGNVMDAARLGELDEQLREGSSNDLVVATGVAGSALGIVAACLTVIAAAAGAAQGAVTGSVSAVSGALAALRHRGVQLSGRLLGGAAAALGVAHGAYTIVTGSSDEEAIAGAISFGTGVAGLSGTVTGTWASALTGGLWGLAIGGYFAVAAHTLKNIPAVYTAFPGLRLHQRLEGHYAERGEEVAEHATWVHEALVPWQEWLASGGPRLDRDAHQRLVWAGRHLAYSLHQLLSPGPGVVDAAVHDYLVDAAGGPDAIPTTEDVQELQWGIFNTASTMLASARDALAALEQLFYDPELRSEIAGAAAETVREDRR